MAPGPFSIHGSHCPLLELTLAYNLLVTSNNQNNFLLTAAFTVPTINFTLSISMTNITEM